MNSTGQINAVGRSSAVGPDITWIGVNPFRIDGLCLGFDDGTIVLSDAAGTTSPHQAISEAKDAINGVASISDAHLAISTRSDVTFLQIESPIKTIHSAYPGGAHGVVATQSGCFVAPLGMRGLLLTKPETGPQQRIHVTTGTEGQLYFYRITTIHDASGKEILVFANRRNGVGLSEFRGVEGRRNVHTMTFEGLDVIDVCGVSSGSLSAIAISPKAEVLWIKDASEPNDPIATKLDGVEGQVYRVLATPRHLFVLTSKALYVWSNLVGKVLYNKTIDPKSVLVLPLEAVDMSLCGNDYICLVMAANAWKRLKISDIVSPPADQDNVAGPLVSSIEMSRKTDIRGLTPDWKRHDVQQGVLVGA